MKKPLILGMIILLVLIGIVIFYYLYISNHRISLNNDSDDRCEIENALYMNPNLTTEERVEDLLSLMNNEEKIGQMVLIEKNSLKNINDISRYNLGGLLSGGGASPKENTPLAWLNMVQGFQLAAKQTCLKIPILYGIDAIHGHGTVVGATIFPHNIGLGATKDADLVKRVASATADEMAATGIYWSFSPNLDIPQDYRWGKTYETFGSDTDNVSQLGSAYLRGVQHKLNGYLTVLATPKHFIGGGAMEYGSARNKEYTIEEGNFTLSEDALRETHLEPFKEAVKNGALSIMVGTASWNDIKNSANHHLLTDILKDELGFTGFIVSDWYGVYLIDQSKYTSLVTAINAGIDMVMTPFAYKDFISNIQKALANGDIKQDRIDDAVKRILRAKFETGLFDRPEVETKALDIIGSSEHKQLAREAVRKSQVLLKNNNNVLPLSKDLSTIVIAGSAADNLGRQVSGWTVEWQGIDGNIDIPGTTILQAIKNTVSKRTKIEYSEKGQFKLADYSADIGIAIIGEKPYAEGLGDRKSLELSPEDIIVINNVKQKSKKLIVIIVSGRPLNIKNYAKNWDAIIASWLPGTEAQGITDVLFGDYPFSAKLPVAWDF